MVGGGGNGGGGDVVDSMKVCQLLTSDMKV